MQKILFVAAGTVIATMAGLLGIGAALTGSDVAVHQHEHEPQRGQFEHQAPLTQPTESLANFRDDQMWRSFYRVGPGVDSREFCLGGDYAYQYAHQIHRYQRMPSYPRYDPYLAAMSPNSMYGGPVLSLPQDGNRFHVTLVYRDKQSDPASKHLANMFMAEGHWLSQLRTHCHFRTASYGDDFFNSWLGPKFGLTPEDLPAVIVTEPINKANYNHPQQGRLVYYAPAWSAPAHPDKLAHEIWTQMAKGPYAGHVQAEPWRDPVRQVSYTPEVSGSLFSQAYQPSQYEQCPPDGCRPRPDERRPLADRLEPFRPQLNLNFPIPMVLIVGVLIVLTLMFLVTIAIGGMYLLRRRR